MLNKFWHCCITFLLLRWVLVVAFCSSFIGHWQKTVITLKLYFLADPDEFDRIYEPLDVKSKKIHVVDSGLTFNLPYPIILRPQRGVDLIISFDFSARPSDSSPPFKVSVWHEANAWHIHIKGIVPGPCRYLWRGRCSKCKRGTWNTAFNRAVLLADRNGCFLIQQQMPWCRFEKETQNRNDHFKFKC